MGANSAEQKKTKSEGSNKSTAQTGISEEYWRKMDQHFEDILSGSREVLQIKIGINLIIVIIGVLLICNAIVYGWVKGTSDGWSIFSGGIGIASLVLLFFYKSQDAVSRAVANLSNIDMIYKSHYRAYQSITDYDFKANHNNVTRNIDDLEKMLLLLENSTQAHIKLIDQYTNAVKVEKNQIE